MTTLSHYCKDVYNIVGEMRLRASMASRVRYGVFKYLHTFRKKKPNEGFSYLHLIFSLLYLATYALTNISLAISIIAGSFESPSPRHVKVFIWFVTNFRWTFNYGHALDPAPSNRFWAYIDLNWDKNPERGNWKKITNWKIQSVRQCPVYIWSCLQKLLTLQR